MILCSRFFLGSNGYILSVALLNRLFCTLLVLSLTLTSRCGEGDQNYQAQVFSCLVMNLNLNLDEIYTFISAYLHMCTYIFYVL